MSKVERRRTTRPGQPKKGERGRPTRYDPTTHPVLGRWMARCGLTDEQMAAEFEVTRQTIHNWRQNYVEFDEALKEGKELADARVEESLYSRAVGFKYDEIHEKYIEIDGEPTSAVERKRVTKQVVPDTQAAIYWLTNRQPERWKAKQQLELVGKDGEKLGFEVVVVKGGSQPAVNGDGE